MPSLALRSVATGAASEQQPAIVKAIRYRVAFAEARRRARLFQLRVADETEKRAAATALKGAAAAAGVDRLLAPA